MTKTVIICSTLAFAVLVTAFVVLSLHGVDTTTLTAFLLFLVMNALPAIGSFVKTHQIGKKVDTVVEHTNGPISETVQSIKDMRAEIHSMTEGDVKE